MPAAVSQASHRTPNFLNHFANATMCRIVVTTVATSNTPCTMTIKELNKIYDALDEGSRGILDVAALIYENLSIHELSGRIAFFGVVPAHMRKQKAALFQHLIDRSLLQRNNIDNTIRVNRKILNTVVREHALQHPNLDHFLTILHARFPAENKHAKFWSASCNHNRVIRDFRIAFFRNDTDEVERLLKLYRALDRGQRSDSAAPWIELFDAHLSVDIIKAVPNSAKAAVLAALYEKGFDNEILASSNDLCTVIEDESSQQYITQKAADAHFHAGRFEALESLFTERQITPGFHAASVAFIRGRIADARDLFIAEIQARIGDSKRLYTPPGIHGIYFLLSMIVTERTEERLFRSALRAGIKENPLLYSPVRKYIHTLVGVDVAWDTNLYRSGDIRLMAPINSLLKWAADSDWRNEAEINNLHEVKNNAAAEQCDFLHYHCHTVLTLIDSAYSPAPDERNVLKHAAEHYLDLSNLLLKHESWEKTLKLLKNIAQAGAPRDSSHKKTRLIWLFRLKGNEIEIDCREQTQQKNGKWSKGRLAQPSMLEIGHVASMTPLDREIAACIEVQYPDRWSRYGANMPILKLESALPLLARHPHLYLAESPTTRVELVETKVELMVLRKGDVFEISFSHPFVESGIQVIPETRTRYALIKPNATQVNIRNAFGASDTLTLPAHCESELKAITADLAHVMTVHSDIRGRGTRRIPTVKADATPHIHLVPTGHVIHAEFFVRPIRKVGQYCRPGEGATTIITEVKGKRKQTHRDLEKERELAMALLDDCPALSNRGSVGDTFEFETNSECLELLLQLQACRDRAVVEWPDGAKLRIKREYAEDSLAIRITDANDWFAIEGALELDESKILDLRKLLASPAAMRFVELGDGEFIALTNTLRKCLTEISTRIQTSGDQLRLHPLHVQPVDKLLSACRTTVDARWKRRLNYAETALRYTPEPPSTFQGELRPYQLEGFRWLSRLSRLGAGACLADDMGLGKTIQAIALILERAERGPTLVVAPASVCLNWVYEASTFAPTLTVHWYGEGDRQAMLDRLGAFDMLVCSYGLLVHDSKRISQLQWTTVVLDEAQAIKNFKAKRTAAALAIQADFRMITTGTPVENHLAELWTLFNFINPGLLGTRKDFVSRFAIPIERDSDRNARTALKRIVQPFLLRRTKTQVLDELPPKTEITISIDMSKEEQHFYEALRRQSLEHIESNRHEPGGAMHIRILAELTRLRRACCQPALVAPDADIPSTKLAVFAEVVSDLIENNHKVLVFSQFTSFLDLIRDVCDTHGFDYQHLDGATPTKERQRRVQAFQRGKGDVFLISIKAGGFGLNLTAADFVIHMDPWWNPAVEDQASDRAHRIGQQRPVTVYRLVARGTVEEKIVKLHKHKRDLAASLLDGADVAASMSAEDLIALMQ